MSSRCGAWIGLVVLCACGAPGGTHAPDAITVNLHNLCSESMTYVVAGSADESEQSIAPGAVVEVQMGPEEKITHTDEHGHVTAWVHTDGAHIWFNSSCNGVGTSEDPDADPAALDRQFAEARARSYFLTSVATAEETPTELAAELEALVAAHLHEGQLVEYEALRTTIHAIEALYAENGYPHANVIPKTEEDGDANKLMLEIVVQPGPTE